MTTEDEKQINRERHLQTILLTIVTVVVVPAMTYAYISLTDLHVKVATLANTQTLELARLEQLIKGTMDDRFTGSEAAILKSNMAEMVAVIKDHESRLDDLEKSLIINGNHTP